MLQISYCTPYACRFRLAVFLNPSRCVRALWPVCGVRSATLLVMLPTLIMPNHTEKICGALKRRARQSHKATNYGSTMYETFIREHVTDDILIKAVELFQRKLGVLGKAIKKS